MAETSSVTRAIALPEILAGVFEYMDMCTLATAVAVCKKWFTLGVAVLWREPTLQALAELSTTRRQVYASKVQVLSFHGDQRELHTEFRDLQFHSLRKLALDTYRPSEGGSYHILQYIQPLLEELHIYGGDLDDGLLNDIKVTSLSALTMLHTLFIGADELYSEAIVTGINLGCFDSGIDELCSKLPLLQVFEFNHLAALGPTMKSTSSIIFAAQLFSLSAGALRIVQSNNDGWAERTLRVFHDRLVADGHDVVLSAPAEKQVDFAYSDYIPPPRTEPCHYGSCPPETGNATGTNTSSPRLHWVNSSPVTAMKYGVHLFGKQRWDTLPELVISGPNVKYSVGDLLFPTDDAVARIVRNDKVPGIIFFASDDENVAWNSTKRPRRSLVQADLATHLLNTITKPGVPYLPEGVYLKVNFHKVEGKCNDASKFRWILTRISPWFHDVDPDLYHCFRHLLPYEEDVVCKYTSECYATVSIGDAWTLRNVEDKKKQEEVRDRLAPILRCIHTEGPGEATT
ncbi:porphobilinogen deaminase protein [Purpureocillium lavendulum]|uniref:Porphobilinogen deaminase protein n=1 Tax=Purpureocillium lavendulum TaxID=1247861 RepID=A0AB34FQE8_9HYPO|nr:porphobilinogen deaminase protein [Purpureocillium lavendulum]